MPHTVAVLTLGCKVNQYESEAIAEAFAAAGFSVCPAEDVCDVYVINTCTVTAESDRKARQTIRRALARNPDALVLVTGCTAQAKPREIAAIKGVADVCGNTEKLSVVRAAQKLLAAGKRPAAPAIRVDDVNAAPFEPMRITRFDRTRAYIKIEDGCEKRCTYCAIPAARGRVRSKPLPDVVTEVETLVAGGCREVVLTGIETAAWGRDLGGATLADLLAAVNGIEGDFRIRLGSLDPALFRADFVAQLAGLSKLAPHFHLSVQSGSSAVLAAMHRQYNADQALAAVTRLRAALPIAELTADLIVGFPGESEADFADTVAFARAAGFLHIHVFPFSPRAGTPAAAMTEQVADGVKKQRAAALIAVGEELHAARLAAAVGKTRPVLFETFENGAAIGHTPEFLEVAAPAAADLHAKTYPVTLLRADNERLFGKIEGERYGK